MLEEGATRARCCRPRRARWRFVLFRPLASRSARGETRRQHVHRHWWLSFSRSRRRRPQRCFSWLMIVASHFLGRLHREQLCKRSAGAARATRLARMWRYRPREMFPLELRPPAQSSDARLDAELIGRLAAVSARRCQPPRALHISRSRCITSPSLPSKMPSTPWVLQITASHMSKV